MKYDRISVGDVVPLEGFRKPFGGDCIPAWYILTTGRMRRDMVAASAWLTANGATECWFPEDVERRQIKRGCRMFREKVHIPVVPGIVFMLTDKLPAWDVIADRKRIRPLQIAERPVIVSERVLSEMESVPERIGNLRAVMRAEAEARRLASLVRIGDRAEFVSGPFRGFTARVEAINGTDAVVVLDSLSLGRVTADTSVLRRMG